MDKRLKKYKRLIKLINFYPPYLGAGIRLKETNGDLTRFRVEMKLRWYNKNLIGVHFGGSLYAMCDPFFMFILLINLGTDYIVWDKTASIDFVKPGKGKVSAVFELSHEQIAEIRQRVEQEGKSVVELPCEVKNEAGETVARLVKGVYVRKKEKK